MEKEGQAQREHDRESRYMKVWLYGVPLVGLVAIASYAIYFGLMLERGLSLDPDQWGSFGDFFGGLMNPLVALAALYWLTRSVALQKRELAETRAELAAQADNGRDSVNLAALTALVTAKYSQIQSLNTRIQSLSASIDKPRGGHGGPEVSALRTARNTLEDRVTEIETDLEIYVERLNSYLPPFSEANCRM